MAKWPNHFISGKQFQKRPNGNPDKYVQRAIFRSKFSQHSTREE